MSGHLEILQRVKLPSVKIEAHPTSVCITTKGLDTAQRWATLLGSTGFKVKVIPTWIDRAGQESIYWAQRKRYRGYLVAGRPK